jgi:heat shock protein HtpX
MLLLGGLYVLFVGVLSLYVQGILPILLVMGAFVGAQFVVSDKLALRSMGASEVEESEFTDLYRPVRRLSQQADLPMPTVAVAESGVPNAFATGRSQQNGTVCVTTGLLATLGADELDGVLAHELAHIENRDVAVMTIASFLSTIAFPTVRWGLLFGWRNRRGGGVVAVIAVSLVVWVVSVLLIHALSRYREFAADRGGALITGNPAALASALATIDGRLDRVPRENLREQADMNAFFVTPIGRRFIGRLVRIHPATERRIGGLQVLERELAGR